MRKVKLNRLCLISTAMLSLTLFGCKQQKANENAENENVEETIAREGFFAVPGAYEIDHPTNLVAYFDSLCQEGAFIATHSGERKDSLQVLDAIKWLDRFSQGKEKVFPAHQIRGALDMLSHEQAYIYGHNGTDKPNGGEVFLFRLIEQAALHCNQISYITDFCTDDRKAGILYFESWGMGNPLYSFLVYQTKKGFIVKMIGEVGIAKIENIYHLTDEQGRDYYLCSNNNDGVYFCQYLYGWQDDQLVLLRELDEQFGWTDCHEKDVSIRLNARCDSCSLFVPLPAQ